MELNDIDIEAYIRIAQKQRSDAMGALLAASWHWLVNTMTRLTQRLAHQPPGVIHRCATRDCQTLP